MANINAGEYFLCIAYRAFSWVFVIKVLLTNCISLNLYRGIIPNWVESGYKNCRSIGFELGILWQIVF